MPLLRGRASHYLLPLNSIIFRSKSNLNLQSSSQAQITTVPPLPTTVPEVGEHRDDAITALPTTEPKGFFHRKNASRSLVDFLAVTQTGPATDARNVVNMSPGIVNYEEEPEGGCALRRFFAAIKPSRAAKDKQAKHDKKIEQAQKKQDKKAELGRKAEQRKKAKEEKKMIKERVAAVKKRAAAWKNAPDVVIGNPTNFQHVDTGPACLRGVGGAHVEPSVTSQSEWETDNE